MGFNSRRPIRIYPKRFIALQSLVRPLAPKVTLLNGALAKELGLTLNNLSAEQQAELLTGHTLAEGSVPFAQAYAGHQLVASIWVMDGPMSSVSTSRRPVSGSTFSSRARDTPFSRGGDGLASLGPMLREYIISEAMAALGIPTSRSLAV